MKQILFACLQVERNKIQHNLTDIKFVTEIHCMSFFEDYFYGILPWQADSSEEQEM